MLSNVNGRETDEVDPVGVWMFSDVLGQFSIRHPFRDELERGCSDTMKRDDVLVL